MHYVLDKQPVVNDSHLTVVTSLLLLAHVMRQERMTRPLKAVEAVIGSGYQQYNSCVETIRKTM